MAAAAAAASAAKKKHDQGRKHEISPVAQDKENDKTEDTDAEPLPPPTGWRTYQPQAARIYNHIYVQVFVAFLIVFNFFTNIAQAQIDPDGTKFESEFGVFELFFNVAFLFELVLNMYAFWCWNFWNSGWNIFDFNVVLIGWLFQLSVPLPGPLKLLRMMRAFRVFRLFKRVASLRKILNSLAKAVPGVMNAFLIQLIVMCIYAIIGVDRFQDYGEDGQFQNEHDEWISWKSGRQQNYGFEYFGDFGKSLFTMFQVLTGESWSEVICRPLFHSNNPTTSLGAAFFFVTFVILNSVVLINVVVAVLLEKMVEEPAMPEEGAVVELPPDPVKESVYGTMEEVSELKTKMCNLMEASDILQKNLADVGGIKNQLAALLEYHGIEAPRVEVPPPPLIGLSAAKNGEEETGVSPVPPETNNPETPVQQPETIEVPS